jgi:hypothetical protein
MQEPPKELGPDAIAHHSADRLALALEDAGFDVGREFPMLHGGLDRDGTPIVNLGYITEVVAAHLTTLLTGATCQ